eukprot:CAMPEP_0118904944 /NCGR_PEP_ID=MMETSP1166-20130328/9201_1 /TAXON_ID=1104430 /ORGANISM="Chrysoreinhardia sp, Strain CCMP3193" /LENGTH=671 /DNA_ID=CAMNT_0006844213 /DNA_START=33 /DNA_END=2048 /DNA_ORIENTATION=-
MTAQEKLEEVPSFLANKKREEGRRLFEDGKLNMALGMFAEAAADFVRADNPEYAAIALANRAVCHGKLGQWKESYADAVAARRMDPKNAKTWLRCGAALEKLGVLKTASSDYYNALERDQKLYSECTAAIERCRSGSIKRRATRELPKLTGSFAPAIEAGKNKSRGVEEEEEASKPPPATEEEEEPEFYEEMPKWVNWWLPAGRDPKINYVTTDDPVEDDKFEPTKKLWFGLGPGRCGLHSLAALGCAVTESTAKCLNTKLPDYRGLLWEPDEARVDVVKRKIWSMRHTPMFSEGAPFMDVCGDVHYAWLPYVRDILKVYPSTKFVVLRRDVALIVESFFYWTEAGSRRRTATVGDVLVFAHAKNHWQAHDQSLYDFDDWDLSFPKYDRSLTKREAILKYVEDYYAECEALADEFPSNFKFFDCDTLFTTYDLKVDFFAWVGVKKVHDNPPDPNVVFWENRQAYVYKKRPLDDFQPGDFRRVDPRVPLDDEENDEVLRLEQGKEEERPRTTRTLVVPPGARPGDTLRFTIGGQLRHAVVPSGVEPGQKFNVPVDGRALPREREKKKKNDAPQERPPEGGRKKQHQQDDTTEGISIFKKYGFPEPPPGSDDLDPFVMPTQAMLDGKEPLDWKHILPNMDLGELDDDFDVDATLREIMSLCKNPIPDLDAILG